MKDMLQRSLCSGLLLSLAAFGVACGSDNLYQLKDQAATNADDTSAKLTAGKAISELKKDFTIQLTEQYALKNDMNKHFSLMSHCKEMEGDKMICALTDSESESAKVIGVETIISQDAFDKLSDEEKAGYHSHKNEVTSGRMTVSGKDEAGTKTLMEKLSKSFGKAELFMMPGTDKMLESTMLLTTVDGGSFGVMGDDTGKKGDDKSKLDDKGGKLTSGGKSADQNLTPGKNPMQSQGAMGEPEPTSEKPTSKEPAQSSEPKEPKEPMKASQGEVPAEQPTSGEPKAEDPAKGTHGKASHMATPNQGSQMAAPSQGSHMGNPQQSSHMATPAQHQGSFSSAPADEPKAPAEQPKGEQPKGGGEPTQGKKFAGQNATPY